MAALGRYFLRFLIFRKIKAPIMKTTKPIATIVFTSILQAPFSLNKFAKQI